MKKILVIALVCMSTTGFSQSGEITIRLIGNCGLHITDGNTHIYVDFPYTSGAHKYMEYHASELDSIQDNAVHLFTHRHTDHYSKKLVKKLRGKIYDNRDISALEELNISMPGFSVQAFKTSHKFTWKHYSYLITWHGKKIYISGDTGDTGPLSKIQNVDWAFVPWWLYRNAREENTTIDTKMFGIYHLYPFQKIGEGFPENVHFMVKQNDIIIVAY